MCINRKDVRLPVSMQRAMATEAEATREAKAKVISAEGEQKASIALKEAADTINQSPVAIQLRYLQTLTTVAAEKNSTIIFPIPIEMMSHFAQKNHYGAQVRRTVTAVEREPYRSEVRQSSYPSPERQKSRKEVYSTIERKTESRY